MKRFAKQTALVSGAGGPMGLAIAHRLAAEGANLLLTDVSGRRLDDNVAKLRSTFPDVKIVGYRASVIVESEVKDLVTAAFAAFPEINILVNVVGGVKGGLALSIENMTEERWASTLDLNLNGIRYLVRALGPFMREQKYGRIVNFSSMSYAGDSEMPEYGAAKAAVASLTRGIALEFAPYVTANCVAPGPIETTVMDRIDPVWLEKHLERTPLRRLGKAEDVAAAVAFLASDDAAYITGTILPVAGGVWPAL